MEQDKWIEQLHDKLADYETAAPEDLWAEIESALGQPVAPHKARVVSWRRWAAAASVAAVLLTGGYLWWNMSSPVAALSASPADSALSSPVAVLSASPADPAPSSPVRVLSGSTAERSDAVKAPEEETEATSVQLSTAKNDAATEAPSRPTPPRVLNSETAEPAPSSPVRVLSGSTAESSHPSTAHHPSPTLSLYAMNGLVTQNNSNGVQMSDALAMQYAETYANSMAASARMSEPIFLTGYEERQHHHQPVMYGLSVSYPLSERLSLSTGVVYTKLRSDFTQVVRSQQIQQEQTLHYIGVPLGMSYRFFSYKGLKTYLSANVKADWNVATHLETEGVSQELRKDRLQWSLGGSLGLQYDILPQLGLYAEPGLSYYPDNGSHIQNFFKDKPLNFSLQLGVRLNLTH